MCGVSKRQQFSRIESLMRGVVRVATALFFPFASAACGDGAPTEAEPPVATLRGRVVTTEGAAAAEFRARARWPGVDAVADLRSDGSFELGLSVQPLGHGTLVIEPADGAAVHHPAWVPVHGDSVAEELRIVLVPRSWRVRNGQHQDTHVAISPAAAADPRVLPSYWGFAFPFTQEGATQTVLDPSRWTAALTTWSPAAFPIGVAIDRLGSTQPMSAADSVNLWNHIGALEQVLGRDLFRPVPIDGINVDEPLVSGAVIIRLDENLDLRGRTNVGIATDWFLSEDVAAWSMSAVTRLAAAAGEITGAVVRLRDAAAIADRALVVHEMMHSLGVGHGCSWISVQTYCTALAAPLPSAEDVAYLELLEAVRAAEKQRQTRHGILAGVFGERVVSLGLAPIPSADLVGGGLVGR